MAQVITNPPEDDVNSSSADSGDVNQPDVDTPPPQESTGNLTIPNPSVGAGKPTETPPSDTPVSNPNGTVTIPNPSVGAGKPTETPPSATPVSNPRSPEDALEEIKTQKTHYLYCSVCKSNITKNAELSVKGQETDPSYTKTNYVMWVLRFNLPRFSRNSKESITSLFTELSLPSPKIRLAVVLLLLSVTVMWFHGSSLLLTWPGPYIKIGWLIHFQSRKYFSIFSLLFLAILALLWHYIPHRGNAPFLKGLQRHIVDLVQNVDILKSIVYGGLIESITSLGVVSSAAASGASTLNVLALGLANLFSGLFLIIQKLYELKKENKEKGYKKWPGEKSKFTLHCVVVVVSFIFFGVIPPLFYGLSFKQTDKGHYKAAVVFAASVVCVISLSFAKAYAFKDSKLRTVAEYTGMAIGASALSFIASQLVSDLVEKYGFHELASDYRKG